MIVQALLNLRPGAQWALNGDDYECLQWLEPPVWEGGQKKPTQEEVEAEVVRLQQEWENTEYQDFVLENTQILKNILMVL